MVGQRLANTVVLGTLILIASCRTGHAQTLHVASEWAVLTAHSMDVASTQRCLGAGRCREVNPWLARYESPVAFTAAKFGVAVGQLWLTRKLHRSHPKLATAVNWTVAGAFSALAMRNARIGAARAIP